jgi:hypothetical protein
MTEKPTSAATEPPPWRLWHELDRAQRRQAAALAEREAAELAEAGARAMAAARSPAERANARVYALASSSAAIPTSHAYEIVDGDVVGRRWQPVRRG